MRTLIALSAAMLTGCTAHQVSPLAGAARSGQISEIRRLIKAGSTPNEGSGVNNWPPLMHAVHKEQREAVRTLR